MSDVNLIYVGDCEWKPSGEPMLVQRPHEVPYVVEPWIGRTDTVLGQKKHEAWRATYAIGTQRTYTGIGTGYITENDMRDNTPFPGVGSCDLVTLMPPDTSKVLVSGGAAIRTARKSANVSGTNLIPSNLLQAGATVPNPVACTREVTFITYETRYTYFALQKPAGAVYTVSVNAAAPKLRRSVIRAGTSKGEVVFAAAFAPAAIVTALTMPIVDDVVSHSAEPIPGTPWYRCTDTVASEFQGDA